MEKIGSFLLCLGFALSIYLSHTTVTANAQFPTSSELLNSTKGGDQVTVSATLSVQVSNATLDTKERMLRNAIIGFLTSGPNVLKANPSEQPLVKTKITNDITNATQSVEGIEATNAIVGVELTKALKGLISSGSSSNDTATVTLSTSSSCIPSDPGVSCSNSVNLK